MKYVKSWLRNFQWIRVRENLIQKTTSFGGSGRCSLQSYSEKIPPPTPWQLSTRSVAQPCVVECGQFPKWTAIQAAKWGSKPISAFGFWVSKYDFRAPDLDGNLTNQIVNWYPFFEPYPIVRHWSPDGITCVTHIGTSQCSIGIIQKPFWRKVMFKIPGLHPPRKIWEIETEVQWS